MNRKNFYKTRYAHWKVGDWFCLLTELFCTVQCGLESWNLIQLLNICFSAKFQLIIFNALTFLNIKNRLFFCFFFSNFLYYSTGSYDTRKTKIVFVLKIVTFSTNLPSCELMWVLEYRWTVRQIERKKIRFEFFFSKFQIFLNTNKRKKISTFLNEFNILNALRPSTFEKTNPFFFTYWIRTISIAITLGD